MNIELNTQALAYLTASVDPDHADYLTTKDLVKRCFLKARKNNLANDRTINPQDYEDAMQEGFMYAWSQLTEGITIKRELNITEPDKLARFLLVVGCGRAISRGAYYTMANRSRLVDIDKVVTEDGSTLAEVLAMPEYNDMDVEYLLTHCELEFGLQPQDATKIRTIAGVMNVTGKLSNKNKQVLKRLKAKYRVK